MPAKDIYHDCVKNALLKDRWTITQDPLTLKWGRREMYVDLGAEKLLAAQKEGLKIAVEVNSFTSPSPINDLRDALGQYIWYADILARLEPDRVLYLAIRKAAFTNLFEEESTGNILLENQRIRLLVFEPKQEVILKWIP